jgi:cytochrome c-type biogenesis protein CcmE
MVCLIIIGVGIAAALILTAFEKNCSIFIALRK